MSEHAKEMREFLLQAKPIDLSKRPATLKLPQGHYGYVLSIFVLMFLAYEFFLRTGIRENFRMNICC